MPQFGEPGGALVTDADISIVNKGESSFVLTYYVDTHEFKNAGEITSDVIRLNVLNYDAVQGNGIIVTFHTADSSHTLVGEKFTMMTSADNYMDITLPEEVKALDKVVIGIELRFEGGGSNN